MRHILKIHGLYAAKSAAWRASLSLFYIYNNYAHAHALLKFIARTRAYFFIFFYQNDLTNVLRL